MFYARFWISAAISLFFFLEPVNITGQAGSTGKNKGKQGFPSCAI